MTNTAIYLSICLSKHVCLFVYTILKGQIYIEKNGSHQNMDIRMDR